MADIYPSSYNQYPWNWKIFFWPEQPRTNQLWEYLFRRHYSSMFFAPYFSGIRTRIMGMGYTHLLWETPGSAIASVPFSTSRFTLILIYRWSHRRSIRGQCLLQEKKKSSISVWQVLKWEVSYRWAYLKKKKNKEKKGTPSCARCHVQMPGVNRPTGPPWAWGVNASTWTCVGVWRRLSHTCRFKGCQTHCGRAVCIYTYTIANAKPFVLTSNLQLNSRSRMLCLSQL